MFIQVFYLLYVVLNVADDWILFKDVFHVAFVVLWSIRAWFEREKWKYLFGMLFIKNLRFLENIKIALSPQKF